MKLLAINCEQCSAPLEIPKGVHTARCEYCNSVLHLDRTASSSSNGGASSEDLKAIRLQNELERLDREWRQRRESFMVKGKHGEMSIPDVDTFMASGCGILFMLFWIFMAGAMFPPFALFGIVMLIFLIFKTTTAAKKMNGYKEAKRRYRFRRQELLSKFDE